MARSKYHNRKTNGFDSKKEAGRYQELKLLEAAHIITDLQTQVKFVLIPAQYAPDEPGRNGKMRQIHGKSGKPKRGRLLERECVYIADFVYTDRKSGEIIVEDAKGYRTDVYKIKKKLMLYVHGIKIREV